MAADQTHTAYQLAATTLLAFMPVPVLYFLYGKYFRINYQASLRLQNLAYGGVLACLFLLTGPLYITLLPGKSFFARAFFQAALPEKLGAFILLYILISLKKRTMPVLEGIITGMLFGMGFAAVENIFYALSSSPSVIIIRTISSVPLHVFTCGIMGAFLGEASLYRNRAGFFLMVMTAFTVPLLIHGFYDYFFFKGGKLPYYNALLLITIGLMVEYFLARSQTRPSREILQLAGIRYEES